MADRLALCLLRADRSHTISLSRPSLDGGEHGVMLKIGPDTADLMVAPRPVPDPPSADGIEVKSTPRRV